jgi:hypothetical protein
MFTRIQAQFQRNSCILVQLMHSNEFSAFKRIPENPGKFLQIQVHSNEFKRIHLLAPRLNLPSHLTEAS